MAARVDIISSMTPPLRRPEHVSIITNTPREPSSPPHIPPPVIATTIHDLPPELLIDVFMLGQKAHAESYAEERGDVGCVFVPFEIVASHTCQRWRDIALITPNLWTYVDFSEGSDFGRSKTYLERSRDAPLDIIIDCTELPGDRDAQEDEHEEIFVMPEPQHALPPPPSPSTTTLSLASRSQARSSAAGYIARRPSIRHVNPEDIPVILDLILPHAYRWRTFDFRASSYVAIHDISHALAALPEAPLLEELHLHHYNERDGDAEHFPYQEMKASVAPFRGIAPKMNNVSLWGVHLDWANCPFLCSRTLQRLELVYHAKDVRPSFPTFQTILSSAPLTTLCLIASSPSETPDNWPAKRIDLSTLTSLTLGQISPTHASALLSRLHIPSLRHLTLDFDMDDYSDTLAVLSDPARGLAQNLECLKLKGLMASRPSRRAFYAALTGLKELKMQACYLPLHFMDALIPGALNETHLQPEGFLPSASNELVALSSLKSLTLMGAPGDLLRPLVAERRMAGAPLQTLMVDARTRLARGDEEWLRGNVDSFGFYDASEDEDVDEAASD
ncbi:unnamed protein product [Peniophora sp. CBMAI 1063]|nr:unnamed protein product [Peniophora sp. CBMAI 1063]